MSRLHLNSIVSWVDSHIIDYLTKNKKILIVVSFISLILLVFFSPIYGMFWLIILTIYFLYSLQYKSIFIWWGVFFFSWYLIFTACLFDYDGAIIIGNENTRLIFNHLTIRYSGFYSSFSLFINFTFESFCFQTLFILDILSRKLGFSLYIPSIYKGLMILFKFIFKGGAFS